MMATNMVKEKMLGCLYGQAIGDALGSGSEFMSKVEVLKNYDQILQDAHRRRWTKGAWIDIVFNSHRDIMLHPACPDNAPFVKAVLDSFFETKEQVRSHFQLINAKQIETKKNRPR